MEGEEIMIYKEGVMRLHDGGGSRGGGGDSANVLTAVKQRCTSELTYVREIYIVFTII